MATSKLRIRAVVLVCLLLYAVGALPRVLDLRDRVIQPDEVHWVLRADDIVARYRAGHWSQLTSNINHPGILPALVMGASQVVGKRVAMHGGAHSVEESDYDPLYSSRLGITLTASLIFPLVFLGGRLIFGDGAAIAAAVLLAFDPNYIYQSQMAHLDAVMAIFVLLTVFFYLWADWTSRDRLKLLAGLFWGMSIATKPTSAVVLIALVVFQFIRARGLLEKRPASWRFVGWYDIGAVAVAHLFLIASYTKLWHTNSSFVWRVGIDSAFASFLYSAGKMLKSHWYLAVGSAFLAAGLIVSARREWSKPDGPAPWPLTLHLKLIAAAAAMLFALWPLRPDIYENVALYWMWAFGLSGESHHGYGYTWTPPPGGYFGLLARQLPLIAFLGLAASLCCVAAFYRRGRPDRDRRKVQFIVLAFLISLLWMILLGVSSKQNVRYILSCFPLLYLCVGYGLLATARKAADLFGKEQAAFRILLLAALIAGHVGSMLSWRPHYGLYRNPLSGGLALATERNESVPPVGIKEAIDFLRDKAQAHGNDLRVMLLGDEYIAKKTERLHYGRDQSKLVFIGAGALGNAEYVLVFPAFQSAWEEWKAQHPSLEFPEVFAFRFKGASLVRVYQVPLPDYSTPLKIKIRKSPKHTGDHRRYGEKGPWTVVGIPGENEKGYILHGQFFRFAPGRYRIRFPLGLPSGVEFDLTEEPNIPVVKVEASQKCTRIVRRRDLSAAGLTDIDLICEPDKYVRSHVRVYWWATTPIAMAAPSAVEE